MRKWLFIVLACGVVVVGAGAFAATEEFSLRRTRQTSSVSMCTAIGDFNRDGAVDRVPIHISTGPGKSLRQGSCSVTEPSAHVVLAYTDADRDGDGARDVGTYDFCVDSRIAARIENIECRELDGVTFHALKGNDCDDSSALRSSQLEEIPADGVDNNCDGLLDEPLMTTGTANARSN